MSAFICRSCRISRQALQRNTFSLTRPYSSQSPSEQPQEPQEPQEPQKSKKKRRKVPKTEDYKPQTHIEKLLSQPQPLWDYLGSKKPPLKTWKVEPRQLHHLLRLSALPMPKSPEEEEKMLNTLALQLTFVTSMQEVNTDGVEPLQSIRDETTQGREEATIGLEALKDALAKEDIKGRSRRPRRRREVVDTKGVEDWDVLGTASEKIETPMGKYFVVRSGKEKEGGNE